MGRQLEVMHDRDQKSRYGITYLTRSERLGQLQVGKTSTVYDSQKLRTRLWFSGEESKSSEKRTKTESLTIDQNGEGNNDCTLMVEGEVRSGGFGGVKSCYRNPYETRFISVKGVSLDLRETRMSYWEVRRVLETQWRSFTSTPVIGRRRYHCVGDVFTPWPNSPVRDLKTRTRRVAPWRRMFVRPHPREPRVIRTAWYGPCPRVECSFPTYALSSGSWEPVETDLISKKLYLNPTPFPLRPILYGLERRGSI